MNQIVELAEKLYNEKNKLDTKYKGIRLVAIAEGIPYWHVGEEGYKIVDVDTGDFKDTVLTTEQIIELVEDEFQDKIKNEFYALDFVKTLIKDGVLLSLEKLGYKNIDSFLATYTNGNIGVRVKEYVAKEDATVVKQRIQEMIDELEEYSKQQIKEGKFDELGNTLTTCGKVVQLHTVDKDLVEEIKVFGQQLIEALVEAKEFEQVVYTTNTLCLLLKELDQALGKRDGRYQYYTDVTKLGEVY